MANVMLDILDVIFFGMNPDVPALKIRVKQVTLNFELE